MAKRLSQEHVTAYLASKGLCTYDSYKNSRTKMRITGLCGHSWEATYASITTGRGCPLCANNIKLTKDIINKELSYRGIKLISDYNGIASKGIFQCQLGHTWEATINNVKNHCSGCPTCSNSTWSIPGYLYILTTGNMVKIGISIDPKQRVKILRNKTPFKDLGIYAIYRVGTGSREETYQLEQEVHKCISKYSANLRGFEGATEFYVVSPKIADDIIQNYGGVKL